MGTDAPESMGFTFPSSNNLFINLEPDDRSEAARLFDALSTGGKVEVPRNKTFWSTCYGMPVDRFGINGMVMVKTESPQAES